MLGYQELKTILPHAYPFLLIDRVEEIKKGESLVAVKNITADEWPFGGRGEVRFFPETLLIEAAAQAALVLYHVSKVKEGDPPPRYYLGRTKAEFFKPVEIGDEVRIVVSGGKMLDTGGYADVDIFRNLTKTAEVHLVYKIG